MSDIAAYAVFTMLDDLIDLAEQYGSLTAKDLRRYREKIEKALA